MECECGTNMLLEFAHSGVEVYTCPWCGATDELDLNNVPCYTEIVLGNTGARDDRT
jgi:hypothetical protein